MLNVYLNTWRNYNENGADGGEWLRLPMDQDELEEAMERIAHNMKDNDPEWFINDYEVLTDGTIEVSEHDNIVELNETLQELEEMGSDADVVAAIIEVHGYSLREAMESVGSFMLYSDMTLDDVAYELVQDCYFTKETPEIFERYFDYAAFARDLSYDGYYECSAGVLVDC